MSNGKIKMNAYFKSVTVMAAVLLTLTACMQNGTMSGGKEGVDYLSTSQGKFPLDSKGFPEQETVEAILDELNYQKAIQAYLWAMPQMVIEGQRNQAKHYGAKGNTDFLKIYKDPALLGILTPNSVVEYMFNFNNYAVTGPMVIDMPGGKLVGLVMDHQMRWSADLGLVSPRGPGPEKILILGPKDIIPEGLDTKVYRVERVNTNISFLAIRVIDPVNDPEIDKTVKFYPYSERTNPKPNKLFQAKQDDKTIFIGAPKGMAYWKQVHSYIQEEDVLEVDRYFMAHLEMLGIEKGKEFKPTARQRGLLERAAIMGEQMALTASFHPRTKASVYRTDSRWSLVITLNPDHRTEYTSQFTERADFTWEAYGMSPSMKTKTPGKGSTYLGAYKDANNNWLDGSKKYTLTLAPDAPAAQFWDVTAYNLESRAILQNKGGKTAVNTFTKDLVTNDDGSVTIYFGPEAEKGKETNWIQTNPDDYWFAYLRLYAPTETYFDKSWPVPNIELVK
jgi:hypothetical protein